MTSQTRTLVVMRHAKTETYAGSDRARALTRRGSADAMAAGAWLVDRGPVPDLVVVSSATRARQTVERMMPAFGTMQPRVEAIDDLYDADVDDVIELCRRLPESTGTVLVVGHNPTMAELVHALQEVPKESSSAHLATAGLAVVELSGEWQALARGSARLVATYVARG